MVNRIEISILFFASAGDLAGTSQLSLSLEGSASLQDVLQLVVERNEAFAELFKRCRFAINEEFVDDLSTTLRGGDEVAILPPMSGG